MSNSQKSGGVLRDSQVTGGTAMRKVDHAMSSALGGYRTGGNGTYANYVEPVLHAGMHVARGVCNPSSFKAETNRAKDELRSVGNGGLAKMAQEKTSGGQCYQNGNYQRK